MAPLQSLCPQSYGESIDGSKGSRAYNVFSGVFLTLFDPIACPGNTVMAYRTHAYFEKLDTLIPIQANNPCS